MTLFIDSSQSIFAAAVFDNNKNNIYTCHVETKYKVEEIINFFNNLPYFSEIKNIYVNLGPGSFTGSRIALLYIRTMAQVNSNIKLFASNTYKILSKQHKSSKLFFLKKFYISATKNKSYCLEPNKISIVDKKHKEVQIDYKDIFNNFDKYLDIFIQENLSQIKPIYASEPQIGEIKK
ncbi:MAG: hypothetical protein HDR43_02050 [Mycoplasma sp.]|nr:hypothetical protein [Mycoplasma sp.]